MGENMAYTVVRHRFTNAVEVEEYHSGKYGAPGAKRVKKEKQTPEQMEAVNRRNREKLCRRKLRRWFLKTDLFLTLTYAVENRPPDMATAKEHFKDFYTEVRKQYRKRGYELRWIRNIEAGTKGAWHIHMVLNRIADTDLIVSDAWPYGTVDMVLCNKKGDFKEIAAYITKTPKTEKRLKEASYNTSRNLPLKEPEKKTVRRFPTWGEIRVPKGFYLDKESFHEGINSVTGFPYREYTLLRLIEKEEKDAESRNLYLRRHKRTGKGNRKGHVQDDRSPAKRPPAGERALHSGV